MSKRPSRTRFHIHRRRDFATLVKHLMRRAGERAGNGPKSPVALQRELWVMVYDEERGGWSYDVELGKWVPDEAGLYAKRSVPRERVHDWLRGARQEMTSEHERAIVFAAQRLLKRDEYARWKAKFLAAVERPTVQVPLHDAHKRLEGESARFVADMVKARAHRERNVKHNAITRVPDELDDYQRARHESAKRKARRAARARRQREKRGGRLEHRR